MLASFILIFSRSATSSADAVVLPSMILWRRWRSRVARSHAALRNMISILKKVFNGAESLELLSLVFSISAGMGCILPMMLEMVSMREVSSVDVFDATTGGLAARFIELNIDVAFKTLERTSADMSRPNICGIS